MSNARKLADNLPSEGQLSGRNVIINGAMQVAQRGTSSTNTNTFGSVDRFFMSASALDELAITQTQASDGPSGFSKSFKVTITTAESSLAADELFSMRHRIEAQNLQLLDFNTSSAKTVTVSFYVKSSITGTYAFAIYNADAGRNITNTYTIDSANTWERKTITIAGDTSGVIDDNNGYAFELSWILSAGTTYTGGSGADSWHTYANNKYAAGHAVDVASTLNATWQVTGVQLEVGSQSTPFEHEPYETTLRKCQRYYYSFKTDNQNGVILMHQDRLTDGYIGSLHMPTEMRAAPTVTHQGMDRMHKPGIRYDTLGSSLGFSFIHPHAFVFSVNASTTDTDSQTAYLGASSGGTINVDAEL